MRIFRVAMVVSALTGCVTDGPAIPPHLDPASDKVAESPQPFERSLAGEVPREAQPLEERKTEAPSGHQHAAELSPAAEMFSCPMHPEVRQGEPGDCPKCGMHLVEEKPAPDAGQPPPRKAPPAPAKPAPAPAAKVYTCPMHPEIRQPKPGRCPKCGMNLEAAAGAHGDHR